MDQNENKNLEIKDEQLEEVSGGAGQNLINCPNPDCGRRFAATHHPVCPYCGFDWRKQMT